MAEVYAGGSGAEQFRGLHDGLQARFGGRMVNSDDLLFALRRVQR